VLARAGHTEAGVDLARLAGLSPAAALCEIVSERDPGEMARAEELREFCDKHGLVMISIAALIAYRRCQESAISHRTEARLPLAQGDFRAIGYRAGQDQREHLGLVHGDIGSGQDVLVRVQSECLIADVFGSRRCECRAELDAALQAIAREGRGVLLYLRGREGPGSGILEKIKAYAQLDLVANPCRKRDIPIDSTDYAIAAQILADLEISSMRLLVSHPAHRLGFEGDDLAISEYVHLNEPSTDAERDDSSLLAMT
jgi:3,4-dihydroxy 2-butanone 4-phosphate synthase/GTP cyclohydrolase II